MSKKNIIVIGGGFGGTSAAKTLVKNKYVVDNYNIILINKKDYLLFTPNLYELAVREKEMPEVTVKLKNIFRNTPVQVINAEVKTIDSQKHEVMLQGGDIINFKFLIIAIGSSVNDYGINGLREYAHFMKTANDAEKINEDLQKLLEICSHSSNIVNIAIGGAGYTGIEIGAEIASYSYDLLEKYGIDASRLNVYLINSSNQLLKSMDPGAGEVAGQKLQELNVRIIENEKVTSIDHEKIFLSDGKLLYYDMFIWTGGVKGNEVIAKSRFVKKDYTPNDRLIVDRFMRVENCENIYACGDAACFSDEILPMLAQVAIDEGKIAAFNITATIMQKDLQPYKLHTEGQFVPLSEDYSYGIIFGHAVKGKIAIFVERVIYLRFLLSVLPLQRAVRKWIKYLLE